MVTVLGTKNIYRLVLLFPKNCSIVNECLSALWGRTKTKATTLRRVYHSVYGIETDTASLNTLAFVSVDALADFRKTSILGLDTRSSNNDPRIITGYFIDAVWKSDGCPISIRANAGTENTFTYVKQRQIFIRSGHIYVNF